MPPSRTADPAPSPYLPTTVRLGAQPRLPEALQAFLSGFLMPTGPTMPPPTNLALRSGALSKVEVTSSCPPCLKAQQAKRASISWPSLQGLSWVPAAMGGPWQLPWLEAHTHTAAHPDGSSLGPPCRLGLHSGSARSGSSKLKWAEASQRPPEQRAGSPRDPPPRGFRQPVPGDSGLPPSFPHSFKRKRRLWAPGGARLRGGREGHGHSSEAAQSAQNPGHRQVPSQGQCEECGEHLSD